MIRLGLRLTLNGGREALARLIMTAVAVALGVGMLLVALAAVNGVNSQNGRYAWLETSGERETAPAPGVDPVWWLLSADEFRGTIVGRVDVAITGPSSPVPPGLTRLPRAGEIYASPALARLLHSTPSRELADRYPGRLVGTLGAAALPSPKSLIVVIGHRPGELTHASGATEVTRIATTSPSSCNGACYFIGIDANGIDLVLAVTAAALLFPMLIFIGTAARLSAARREQRFAAMRLVGATPRQISVISTVESAVAGVAGMLAGFGLFFLVRPSLTGLSFTGDPFAPSDLSLNLGDILAVALGVPVAAAVAARLALRRVQISPLGVTRRTTPPPPRAYRLFPLVAGLLELSYFAVAGRPATTPGQIQAFLTGILMVMVGLVLAGPWLTMVGSRLIARRTNRPEVLIAGRRLSDNPQAGFRAISGLVLALFVTSVALGIITTIKAYDTGPAATPATRNTVLVDFTDFRGAQPSWGVRALPDPLLSSIRSTPGVQAVTLIHHPSPTSPTEPYTPGLVACADLARTPALGRCPAGAVTAGIVPNFAGRHSNGPQTVLPPRGLSPAAVAAMPVQLLAVATDGSTSAIERVRTSIDVAYPHEYAPATIVEQQAQLVDSRLIASYQQLVDVILLVSLPIAGCSLAVSVAAGLGQRKRPFSLLRLTGVPAALLRRVVAVESVVPLLALSALSVVSGFLAAALFLDAQLDETLHAPPASYYVIVVVGLVASLAIIASTLPLLERITGPESARND